MRPLVRTVGTLATPPARAVNALLNARGNGDRLTLLGWHRIGTARDGLTTTLEDFRGHLDVLERWGATVLPLLEAQRLLVTGRLPERAVVLTLDDGYASIVEQAWPELRRRGMPATLFAVSGYLAEGRRFPWDHAHPAGSDLVRLATADQVVAASRDGLDIGSHTVTHRWLPGLAAREVAVEVRRSREDLAELVGQPVDSFAYPMGGWTPTIRDEVARAGYDVAVTVDRGSNRLTRDPHALRRAFAFDRPEDVRRQLAGGFTWMRMVEGWRRRMRPRW